MIYRQNRIIFTILSGIVLLMASGIPSAYAQGTPVDFGGTWNTVTGKGKKIVIRLESVRRTSVTGFYGKDGLTGSYRPQDSTNNTFVKVSAISGEPALQIANSLTGTVTDNVLRFKWSENGGRGAGRFTMSSDGESFEGTFSMTDNPDDTSGGTWNGTRAPNFYGAWQTTVGGNIQFPDLVLQQGGNRVTGRLSANNPYLGIIKEGVIDGNKLSFLVFRPNPVPGRPDVHIGVGELVMDRGSKSFKGTILGIPTSGTRLGR